MLLLIIIFEKFIVHFSFHSRGNKYLQKSSVSRVCAVGGFFISIPIFLTGKRVINQFDLFLWPLSVYFQNLLLLSYC